MAALLVAACGQSHEPLDASPSDTGLHRVDSGACPASCATRPLVDVILVLPHEPHDSRYALMRVTRHLVRLARTFDVRVAVLSDDLGIGSEVLSDRGCSAQGAEAILGVPSCSGGTEQWIDLAVPSDGGDEEVLAASLRDDLLCGLETNLCTFIQPMAALARSVSPHDSALDFNGFAGQADEANEGFLRPDAALAVLMIAHQSDCSATDQRLYDPGSEAFPPDGVSPALRCAQHPEALYAVEWLVDALASAREPRQLAFYFVGGIPSDLEGRPPDEVLADARMQEVPEPTHPSLLTRSCNGEYGSLLPPRRQLEALARLEDMGAPVGFASACTTEYGLPLDGFEETVASAACERCVRR